MFLCFEDDTAAEDDAITTSVRGKPAAQAHFAEVESSPEAPTLADLEPLVTYDWLLDREQAARLQGWLQAIWTSAGMAGCTAAMKRSSTNNQPASSSKKARVNTSAEQDHAINIANSFA